MFDHPISQIGYVLVGLLVCTLLLYPFIGVLYVSILYGAHWILMAAAPALILAGMAIRWAQSRSL